MIRKKQQELIEAEKKDRSAMLNIVRGVRGFVFAVIAVAWAMPVEAADGQVSMATPKMLKLQIMTQCTGDTAVFRIANRGGAWPATSTFSVYRTEGQKLISQRRLRLAAGQRASFKVKQKKATGEVALWIKPSWYERPFKYDATVVCE